MRLFLGCMCLVWSSTAFAQATVQVSGRLIDRVTGLSISRGTARIDSGAPVTVAAAGTFRLQSGTGSRMLTIHALGYAPWERKLQLVRDTSILVEMEARPFE